MEEIQLVDPFDCRMWHLHDRLGDLITEESCGAEINSFLHHGQVVPVLGRKLDRDPNHKIELIYGARRLFVAKHLNVSLKVQIREMSDLDAIIAMDIENRQRMDISAYERGMSYSRWIRSGFFKSQEEIARALKVSRAQVSRLLSFSKIPAVVIQAFSDPAEICEGWGPKLLNILSDPQRRQAVIDTARVVIGRKSRPNDRSVYRELISAASPGRKIKLKAHDEVILDENGAPLFRIQYNTSAIAVQLPLTRMSAQVLEEIRNSIVSIMERSANSSIERGGSTL